MHERRAVGLDDVARIAGVSVGAASRALRGLPGVSADTRRRIEVAAFDVGYQLSPSPTELTNGAKPIKRVRSRTEPRQKESVSGILQVAALAGVSPATVSRALRNLPGVAPATQLAVEQAASALGYSSSPIAAALAKGRSGAIGVLAPWVSRWFFGAVIDGARQVLIDQGYELLLYPVDLHQEPRFHPQHLTKRVDGVMRVNLPHRLYPLSDSDRQIPHVTIGNHLPGVSGVQLDDVQVGHMATTHLLNLGHRRIAFLGIDTDSAYGFEVADDRYRGYVQAHNDLAIRMEPALVKGTGFSVRGGEAGLSQLLADVNGDVAALPTAVVAVSDEVAMGLIHGARRRGIKIPNQLSIIGVDNHDLAYLFDLTTIGQPVRDQGREAATMLVQQIESGGVLRPTLSRVQPTLVQRLTTGAPPPRS